MRSAFLLLPTLFSLVSSRRAYGSPGQGVTIERCDAGAAYQQWTFVNGRAESSGLCLTATATPIVDQTALTMAPCTSSKLVDNSQLFTFAPGGPITLTSTAQPTFCVNVEGYGTTPGSVAWLFTCNTDCKGNCEWVNSNSTLVNPLSGLCLDNGSEPPPPPSPHTCDPASPSAGLPFCDYTQPIEARVADLWSRLSDDQRIDLFSIPIQPNAYDPVLNLPSVYWDITCIAGLSPGRISPGGNYTVFPNTIGQAASFDTALVARIANATAEEGRILNQINYRLTGGRTWQGVLCDGGPLANTAHDPRWGRTSETYGEDVHLTQQMGIAATRALQQRTDPSASNGLDFLKTSQVTRHYMGTHGANDMPYDAEEYILPQWREEHQMRIYEAFQRPDLGGAEGIMCAISAFAEAGDVPPPRNTETSKPYIPNCANPYLMTQKLRTEWGSGCFVQSDCCDSIDAVVSHRWVDTLPEAVAAVVNAGLSASYGNYAGITAALRAALNSSAIPPATFAARIQRTLLTLFRVGMFDTHNPANPHRGPFDESLLDGPQHRALAREAAGKSTVLLENRAQALPLPALPARVAVLGPFAHCTDRTGDYGCHEREYPNLQCSYGHSYSGTTSAVSTVLLAAQAEAAGAGAEVRTALGSGINVPAGAGGLAEAANLTAWADLVVLVVGTGCKECEGGDRRNLTLSPPQAALVAAVSAAMAPTARLVVAIASAGGVDLQVPRADAVLQVFYNGEETGSGLWDVIMGRLSPSARMPETVYAWQYLELVAPEVNFNARRRGGGLRVRARASETLGPPPFFTPSRSHFPSLPYTPPPPPGGGGRRRLAVRADGGFSHGGLGPLKLLCNIVTLL